MPHRPPGLPAGSRARVVTASVLATLALASGCASSSSPGSTAVTPTPVAVARSAAVPSAGCADPPAAAVTNQRVDLTVGGAPRWYLLTTPSPTTPTATDPAATVTSDRAGAPVPRPLVLDFHGLAEGAVLHSVTTQFGALGQQDGFVVAFPNGRGSPVQWDTADHFPANPDLQFVGALLTQVEATHCIDLSRVYASGFSDGSFMVSMLACTMSTRFAAIAAVSGLQFDSRCPTSRRVPIIAFHGTADPILYFNGGVGTATLNRILGSAGPTAPTSSTTTLPVHLNGKGYPATVRAWAAKDGCAATPTTVHVAPTILLRTYHCPPGTAVEFYIVLGGGHAWPGSRFSQSISSITGTTTFAINATSLIWTFFQRFQL
jgi:polyhydroxybutyrate depolymerase